MSFRINTNIAAMTAYQFSSKTALDLNKSLDSLSSGLRINKAADDAAGLSIANKLSAQADGLGQAIKNANDAIGMIQTADGAMDEYTTILKRVRTLAGQAANDTQSVDSRAAIQSEIDELLLQADDIATSTKFNDISILDGTGGTAGVFKFHVGAYSGDTQTVDFGDNTVATIVTGATDVTSQAAAETTIASMDAALKLVDANRSTYGAAQNRLESTVRNITVTQTNVTAAESQIRDVDFAAESAKFSKLQIMAQAGSFAMTQANAVQQNVLRLLQ